MSNLTRWEPVREMMSLREAMDRLFDDAFTHPLSPRGISLLPAVDLVQTADELVVMVNLPGMSADQVQITVTGNTLTLRGEFQGASTPEDATYYLNERRLGSFERTLTLPVDVQADQAKAEFENGVLTIRLQKAEAARPKTITVKAK